MKVLITGGSGFIGSHLADKLIDAGHSVCIFDIKKPHRSDVAFLQGSIISQVDVKRGLEDIEVVYHLAGVSNINLVKENPLETIESNILGTAYLLDESKKQGVRCFILASSVYVYDEKGHLYTTAKLASELLCKNYHTLYGLPYTILRYGTAYGPRSRGADIVSIFMKQAIRSGRLAIHGSGDQKRNFIHVEDLACGSVLAMSEAARQETLVLAGLEAISIKELAVIVNKLFQDKLAIEHKPQNGREDDYEGEIKDLFKAVEKLGWKPSYSIEEGIRNYKEWYLSQIAG